MCHFSIISMLSSISILLIVSLITIHIILIEQPSTAIAAASKGSSKKATPKPLHRTVPKSKQVISTKKVPVAPMVKKITATTTIITITTTKTMTEPPTTTEEQVITTEPTTTIELTTTEFPTTTLAPIMTTLDQSKWNEMDLYNFIVKQEPSLNKTELYDIFISNEVDGPAFLLLTKEEMTTGMKLKFGTALKLQKIVDRLNHERRQRLEQMSTTPMTRSL